MPRVTRFKIAKSDIENYLGSLNKTIFLKKDIGKILRDQRGFWRLPLHLTTENFMQDLLQFSKLKKISIYSPNYNKTLIRYSWDINPSIYQIALSIKSNSFLAYYTAMFFHNLTKQIPKIVYLNSEQREKSAQNNILEQNRIDLACRGKERVSKYIFNYDDWQICCVNGKHTNNLGVEEYQISPTENISITNIERTLIDIAVRPVYSGGIYEVLNAFKEAKGKFSVNKLMAMLNKFDYVYPYHQVIGFYMERAGYQEPQLSLVRKIDKRYNFYLTHDMKQTSYSPEWKLYFPKNF